MSEDEPEIRSIPVDLITVQNPRVRNKRIFQELVDSIAHLGLKKPITVSKRLVVRAMTSCADKAGSKRSLPSVKPKSRPPWSRRPKRTATS